MHETCVWRTQGGRPAALLTSVYRIETTRRDARSHALATFATFATSIRTVTQTQAHTQTHGDSGRRKREGTASASILHTAHIKHANEL